MLDYLKDEPQNVCVIGDCMVSPDTIEEAVRASAVNAASVVKLAWFPLTPQKFAEHQLNIERNGAEAEPIAEGLLKAVADATVIVNHLSPIPRQVIEEAPSLRAILTSRGGLEHIDIAAATERDIPVINVIRNAIPVAEFALGLIISVTRNIANSHAALKTGVWQKKFSNQEYVTTLGTMLVGLIGLGNVGIELAWRLKALGVNLIAYEPHPDRERLKRNGLDGLELVGSVEEVFSRADVVSLHARLAEENARSFDKRLFSLMKPSAYFVNTARGGLVNEEDLIDALAQHAIAGAALDVYDSEPLSSSSPLLSLDNVTITSHIAGQTVDAISRSPFLLMKEVDNILEQGKTERIVNYRNLKL